MSLEAVGLETDMPPSLTHAAHGSVCAFTQIVVKADRAALGVSTNCTCDSSWGHTGSLLTLGLAFAFTPKTS